MQERPRARTDVIAEAIDDELVVYDPISKVVHCLGPEVARVWELCDGQHSAGETTALLPADPEVVTDALHALDVHGLLKGGLTRREMGMILAAAAVPHR